MKSYSLHVALSTTRRDFEIVTDYHDRLADLLYEPGGFVDGALDSDIIRESLDAIVDILEREVETQKHKLRLLEKLYYGR